MRRAEPIATERLSRRRLARAMPAATIAAAAGIPSTASAHLVTTGLGPFYDGISHFALSPESLLAAVALALLAGFGGAGSGRAALFAGSLGWLAGGLLGLAVPRPVDLVYPTLVPLALGLALAAGARLRPAASTAAAVLAGGFIGFANGTALGQGNLGALGVVGTVAAVFVLLSLASATAAAAEAGWARTAVRVAGSWVAAISLLLIGWWWRNG